MVEVLIGEKWVGRRTSNKQFIRGGLRTTHPFPRSYSGTRLECVFLNFSVCSDMCIS